MAFRTRRPEGSPARRRTARRAGFQWPGFSDSPSSALPPPFLPAYAEVQYNPVAGSVKGTLTPLLLGRFRRPLNATWLISTPGSTPAVQLAAGMFVSVTC